MLNSAAPGSCSSNCLSSKATAACTCRLCVADTESYGSLSASLKTAKKTPLFAARLTASLEGQTPTGQPRRGGARALLLLLPQRTRGARPAAWTARGTARVPRALKQHAYCALPPCMVRSSTQRAMLYARLAASSTLSGRPSIRDAAMSSPSITRPAVTHSSEAWGVAMTGRFK